MDRKVNVIDVDNGGDMEIGDDEEQEQEHVQPIFEESDPNAPMQGEERFPIEYPPVDPKIMRAQSMDGEIRKVLVPSRRISPLRASWAQIVAPIVQQMGLQIRFNTVTKCVELRAGPATVDPGAVQRGEDFVRAFILGFELKDAVALLRLEDLYIDTFDIDDVKTFHGEHLSRAIGRIVGKDGSTKYAIENTTRTRIVIADKRIHILGTYGDIHVARNALCSLILGSPPNKVYAKLKTIASRMKDRY